MAVQLPIRTALVTNDMNVDVLPQTLVFSQTPGIRGRTLIKTITTDVYGVGNFNFTDITQTFDHLEFELELESNAADPDTSQNVAFSRNDGIYPDTIDEYTTVGVRVGFLLNTVTPAGFGVSMPGIAPAEGTTSLWPGYLSFSKIRIPRYSVDTGIRKNYISNSFSALTSFNGSVGMYMIADDTRTDPITAVSFYNNSIAWLIRGEVRMYGIKDA